MVPDTVRGCLRPIYPILPIKYISIKSLGAFNKKNVDENCWKLYVPISKWVKMDQPGQLGLPGTTSPHIDRVYVDSRLPF